MDQNYFNRNPEKLKEVLVALKFEWIRQYNNKTYNLSENQIMAFCNPLTIEVVDQARNFLTKMNWVWTNDQLSGDQAIYELVDETHRLWKMTFTGKLDNTRTLKKCNPPQINSYLCIALAAKGINSLGIRGPLRGDLGNLVYTTIVSETNGLFDFTIRERLKTKENPPKTIYEATFTGGKVGLEEKEEDGLEEQVGKAIEAMLI